MWFYMIAAFLILIGIVGGALSGGIFTIIFIPLGFIILIVALVIGAWGRASQTRQSSGPEGDAQPEPEPLRRTPAQGTPGPGTPEELVDARRAQQ